MKKITLICIAVFFAISAQVYSADIVVADFESGTAPVGSAGATSALVANPLIAGINTTANVVRVGRSNQNNYYSAIPLTKSFVVTKGTSKYLHILAKYDARPYFQVVLTGPSKTYKPYRGYVRIGEWQDIVIELKNPDAVDYSVTGMNIQFDCSSTFANPVVNNVLATNTGFAYLDEVIINDSPTPRGLIYNDAEYRNIYDFEAAVPSSISDIVTFTTVNGVVTYPESNPFTNGINTTANCGKRTYVSGTNFWAGFQFEFVNPVFVDAEHRYLHVMMTVPADNAKISLDARKDNISTIKDRPYTITSADTWEDVVLDLNALPYVSGISIKCGVNNGNIVGNYYFDEISINGNPNPRVIVAGTKDLTSLPDNTTSEFVVSPGATLNLNDARTLGKLTIEKGAKVTNNTGNSITTTDISLESDASGTGTYVDLGTTNITGQATAKQYLSAARNWYLTSPLVSSTTPTNFTYFRYLEDGSNASPVAPATTYWQSVGSAVEIIPTVGLIALPSQPTTISFSSTTGAKLNNGNIETELLTRTTPLTGFNLIGNPYPSYLNMDGFASSSVIEPTYWLRSKNGSWGFDTYNIPSALSTGGSGYSVTAYVPPMQAFWVRLKNGVASGKLNFTNTMRDHIIDANNKFRAPKAANSTQKIIRLQVSNGTYKDEAVVYFNQNASDNYDIYDSPKMFNNNRLQPEIFTQEGTERLAINGRNELTPETEVTIGFKVGETNDYSIIANEITNIEEGTQIFLKDKSLDKVTELTINTPYNFKSDSISTTNRFSLIFKSPSVTTGITEPTELLNNISVYQNANRQIVVKAKESNSEMMVRVYNTYGQIMEQQLMNSNSLVLNKVFNSGVYIVSISTIQNNTINKQLIIQ